MSRQFDHLADVEVFLIVVKSFLLVQLLLIYLQRLRSLVEQLQDSRKIRYPVFRRTTRHLSLTEAGKALL